MAAPLPPAGVNSITAFKQLGDQIRAEAKNSSGSNKVFISEAEEKLPELFKKIPKLRKNEFAQDYQDLSKMIMALKNPHPRVTLQVHSTVREHEVIPKEIGPRAYRPQKALPATPINAPTNSAEATRQQVLKEFATTEQSMNDTLSQTIAHLKSIRKELKPLSPEKKIINEMIIKFESLKKDSNIAIKHYHSHDLEQTINYLKSDEFSHYCDSAAQINSKMGEVQALLKVLSKSSSKKIKEAVLKANTQEVTYTSLSKNIEGKSDSRLNSTLTAPMQRVPRLEILTKQLFELTKKAETSKNSSKEKQYLVSIEETRTEISTKFESASKTYNVLQDIAKLEETIKSKKPVVFHPQKGFSSSPDKKSNFITRFLSKFRPVKNEEIKSKKAEARLQSAKGAMELLENAASIRNTLPPGEYERIKSVIKKEFDPDFINDSDLSVRLVMLDLV